MTKACLFLLWLCAAFSAHAQTHTESFFVCNKSYIVTCEQLTGQGIKLTFIDGLHDTSHVTDSIVTNNIEVFATHFRYFFINFIGHDDSAACPVHDLDTTIASFGRQFYLNFLASQTKDGEMPTAGVFKARDSIIVKYTFRYLFRNPGVKPDKNGKYPILKLQEIKDETFKKAKVENVKVEFNNGFIENIKASIKLDDGIHYFTIPYPVGVSSVANFKSYRDRQLFDMNSPVYLKGGSRDDVDNAVRKAAIKGWNSGLLRYDSSFFIRLGDLIDYDYYLGVDRRDYSPKNDTLLIDGGQGVILHKEATDRLFEAHIFTDFIGLSDNKPNGLIQTEISKRINVNTLQHLSRPGLYWLARSYGGFQYVEPVITLSKLEQHNKRLVLGDLDSVRFNPGSNDTSKFNKNRHRYASALDLYQYQSFSAGLDVNIAYLNNHDLKYSVSLNVGARLGITSVTDSNTTISQNTITRTGLVREYTINTFQWYPTLIFTFLPEERFNLSIKEQLLYLRALSPDVQLVSYDKADINKLVLRNSGWLNMLELLMTIQVNPNSKLFGRVRLNSDLHNSQSNFAQVQVGYSTFILGGKH